MGFATVSLKGRALRLLAQREHSRAELQTKLARHVQEGEDLAAVLDELEAKDFINAGRVADSVVNRRAPRLGMQRVMQELRGKGLDEALVRATAERLKDSELDRARAVWSRRFDGPPQSLQERAKQTRFLMTRGFGGDTVRKVLTGAFEDTGDEGGAG